MFIPNCIKFDTMTPEEIQNNILKNCDNQEAITSELLWKKCGSHNKNKFYEILLNMQEKNWIKRTTEGIIRIDFSKENSLMTELDRIEKLFMGLRKIIAKEDKPLFMKIKNREFYLTKNAEERLIHYFSQCDYYTLNVLNRNFLQFRLNLITPNNYKKNIKSIEDRFDNIFFSLINDHKSFKKQLIDYYSNTIHKTGFIV